MMTSSVPFGVTGSSRDGTAYTAVVRGLGVACALPPGLVSDRFTRREAQADPDQFLARPRDRRLLSPLTVFGAIAAEAALRSAGLAADERTTVETRIATGNGDSEPDVERNILMRLQTEPGEGGLNLALAAESPPLTIVKRLPNMLAGLLAGRSGVHGASRTFVGGAASAADALRSALISVARPGSGRCLVGGAFSLDGEESMRRSLAGGALPAVDAARPFAAAAFLLLERKDSREAAGDGRSPCLELDGRPAARDDDGLGAAGLFFELAEAVLRAGSVRVVGGVGAPDPEADPPEAVEGEGWRIVPRQPAVERVPA